MIQSVHYLRTGGDIHAQRLERLGKAWEIYQRYGSCVYEHLDEEEQWLEAASSFPFYPGRL